MSGFIRLERDLVHGGRWRNLSSGERVTLIDLWGYFNGHNNGDIAYGIAQAQAADQCSRRTAIRNLQGLEKAGMIEAVQRGGFRWKSGAREGRVTVWRILVETGAKQKAKVSQMAPSEKK